MNIEINNVITCSEVFNVNNIPKNIDIKFNNWDNRKCKALWTFLIYIGNYITFPSIESGYSLCGFKSKQEADQYRSKLLKDQPFADKVAVVMKDTSNDGRGLNEIDKIFKSIHAAHEYVLTKKGFGYEQRRNLYFGVNIYDGLYGHMSYDGYTIKLITIQ